MTKSFTALAILKLRDEGKLSLEDPVSKWIPEFARMPLPTRDTAPLRIRQLLSHSAGFPFVSGTRVFRHCGGEPPTAAS